MYRPLDWNAFVPRHKTPRRFDDVVNAVKKVLRNSHFDQGVQNVATPSLSLKTGHSLKKCINILRCHALRRKDKGLEEDVDKFEKLIAAEWSYHVSHHSLSALSTKKLTKLICCHLQKISRNSWKCPFTDVFQWRNPWTASSAGGLEYVSSDYFGQTCHVQQKERRGSLEDAC